MSLRVIFFALLLIFWLMLSSQHVALIITLGVASAALVVWLGSSMGILGADLHTLSFYMRLPWYALWLAWNMAVSCVRVAVTILHPSLPITPGFIRVPMSQKKDLGKLVHANSITLTPGTASTRIEDDYIEVHALKREDNDAAQTQLDRRVTRLEGEH